MTRLYKITYKCPFYSCSPVWTIYSRGESEDSAIEAVENDMTAEVMDYYAESIDYDVLMGNVRETDWCVKVNFCEEVV